MALEKFIELNDRVPLWRLSRRPMLAWVTADVVATGTTLEEVFHELFEEAAKVETLLPIQGIEIKKVEGPNARHPHIICEATVRYAQEDPKGEMK